MCEDCMCGDNRFELINKYKEKLINATNIKDSPEEMKVLDDILFRLWQMRWLDYLEYLPYCKQELEYFKEQNFKNETELKKVIEETRWHKVSEEGMPKYAGLYLVAYGDKPHSIDTDFYENYFRDGIERMRWSLYSNKDIVAWKDFKHYSEVKE